MKQKYTILFLCMMGLACCVPCAFAQDKADPATARVTLDLDQVSLGDLLATIRAEVEISYIVPDAMLRHPEMTLSIHVKDQPVKDVVFAAAAVLGVWCDVLDSGLCVFQWPREEWDEEDEEDEWDEDDDDDDDDEKREIEMMDRELR